MCTGITLIAQDGSAVYGRTMEWGSFDLVSRLAIVPPGTPFQGSIPPPPLPFPFTPQTGMSWTTNLGFVGMDALEKDNVFVDGMNQAGLACGLFYHPGYAVYEDYNPQNAATSLCATDLVQYILGQCSSLDQVRKALANVHVVPVPEHALGDILLLLPCTSWWWSRAARRSSSSSSTARCTFSTRPCGSSPTPRNTRGT